MKLSSIVLILVLAISTYGCSDSEQDKRNEERQARIEREVQEQANKANEERQREQQAQQEELNRQTAEEEARPREPEYREVETYIVTFSNGKTIECENKPEAEACGVAVSGCGKEGSTYLCQRDLNYVEKTTKVLVQDN